MKIIQIRDVPDDLRRELKLRAVAAGTTLSEYLKEQLTEMVRRPTPEEWVRTLPVRSMTASSGEIVETIREARASR